MSLSRLQDHLGYWLRLVSNSVSQSFARKVEEAGVTVAEWVLLRQLLDSKAPVAPSALAAELGISRGAVSKLVERLRVKGLLTRNDAEGDKRFQELALGAKGRALVPKLAALADKNDEEYFGVLSRDEAKFLKKLLIKLASSQGLTKVPMD